MGANHRGNIFYRDIAVWKQACCPGAQIGDPLREGVGMHNGNPLNLANRSQHFNYPVESPIARAHALTSRLTPEHGQDWFYL